LKYRQRKDGLRKRNTILEKRCFFFIFFIFCADKISLSDSVFRF